MAHEQVTISTRDGNCPAHVLTPEGAGPWPAVIVYMDGLGIRQTLVDIAARLAGHGYVVLLPDIFYRYGAYGPLEPKEVMKGDFRAIIGPMRATTDELKATEDTGSFIAWLDSRGDVAGKIGTVGFCMGGGMALAAAGAWPDRIGAVASFHGGNLATDGPASPHLLAPHIKAEVYIAAAENDHTYPPEMAARTEQALSDAGVRFVAETYRGAAHGWMKPDFPVYDEAAAERGWREMLALFERTLK